MKRIFSGRDEIRFDESARAAAEEVAAALPEIRRRGEEIANATGPKKISIIITEKCPRARHIYKTKPIVVIFIVLSLGIMSLSFLGAPLKIATQYAVIWLFFGIYCWLFFRKATQMLKRSWSHVGGLAMMTTVFSPVIVLHWPRPQRSPAMAALGIPHIDPEALRMTLAHEYAHMLSRTIRQCYVISAWLDEGFSIWFMEQATGLAFWKPESRACVDEPDEKKDPRWRIKPSEEHYIRLMARYYWEVKALAEEGKLMETLTASKRDLAGLRPKLHKDE